MIVGALSITETITWGIVYYGFAVFLTPMERDLGFSRVALTGAFSLGLLAAALAGLPIGGWIDRHGARGVMTIGSCAAVALMLAWSRVDSLLALYVVWTLMGLALAATLYEPAFAAIIGWFRHHRDRALLTLTLVAGLASTIFVPIETWLLSFLDWRTTLITLAVFLAISTIPLHAFVLRAPPRHAPSAVGATDTAERSASLHEALHTVVFWVLTGAFVASNFAVNAVTVHVIPYLTAKGYPLAQAAMVIGWMGAMQLVGRILFGPIEIFGRRSYGAISGAMALGSNGARAVAPVGAALMLAALGSYEAVFWIVAVAVLLAGFTVLFARDPAAE